MKGKNIAAVLIALTLLLGGCGNGTKKGTDAGANPPENPPQAENGAKIVTEPENTSGTGSLKEEDPPEPPQDKEMNGTAGQLYSLAFQAMFDMDEGLNGDMKYIAMDLSELTQLTEEDKAYILDSFEDYGVEIRDETFDRLQEQEPGFKEKMVLEGVLLRVEKVDISKDAAVIEGSKYRSGNGAVGTKITLKLEDGAWSVTDAGMTWIS
ncbi:hypothetical protein [Paenibacillus sp. DYY-L-2]|uniref:hypothetical protein n=1 Tax=Paenibacillus sp. DYY-L-2 TaxID=3447013 RepID=UPI003F4FB5E9